ncbi:MAG TPA: TlyA family RNA methyltransferase [Micropepsaceae bacterium]|nr:TlyA family RNA methyltransferase [Micropepsaceae bacterium]
MPRRGSPDGSSLGLRADIFLVKHGHAASREEAQAAIRAGLVKAGGQIVTKPAQLLKDGAEIQYRRAHSYVSRGGVKLTAALDRFGLSPADCVCLDIGSSTGGFTQVLLDRGAARVYCVDVGHGQLDAKLQATGKVVLLEGVNARRLGQSQIPEAPAVVTGDLSFISLRQAIGPALSFARGGAWAVLLVKPQFEAGPDAVPRNGVVRDQAVQQSALADVTRWVVAQGWEEIGSMDSPITGKTGNREFLLAVRKEI